jgi:hypothetical protein
MIGYGIFSRPEADDDGPETLYRVEDLRADALLWLGRYAAHRAYGNIPTDALYHLLAFIDGMREADDISKEFRLGGQVFYVRQLTDDEMVDLIEKAVG